MTTKRVTLLTGFLVIGLCSAPLPAQDPGKQKGAVDTSRDSRVKGPTADQQKENKSDREITRDIRRAVVADKSLSTMAHNVKIITTGGMVTLRGVVRSEEEKKSIEEKAATVVDASKIKNDITISANHSTDAEAAKKASKTKTN